MRYGTPTHYPCGHPRGPENSYTAGRRSAACATCVRAKGRLWYANNKERNRERGRRWYRENADKAKANVRRWRDENPDKALLYTDTYRFGISRTLLSATCEVCGTAENLSIDHDHDTGRVRGRLCRPCNSGLGFFHDSAELMRAAIDYLAATEERMRAMPVARMRQREVERDNPTRYPRK